MFMKVENKFPEQMDSASCFFRIHPPWIFALASIMILAAFLGYGFLSIFLTSVVLILSTLVLNLSNRKQTVLVQKSITDEIFMPDQGRSPYMKDVISEPLESEHEFVAEEKDGQEKEGRDRIDEYLSRSSPVILSENDGLGRSSTSEDSEVEWVFQDKMFQSPDCSDGSISDEDSLIEIALPGGHYVGRKEDEAKYYLQKKLPDFTPGTCFKQRGLVELLAAELNEMNEEENLIEIDISMGSIKYPRFEIEA